MFSIKSAFFVPVIAALFLLAATANVTPARADDGFPFGMEMTLDAAPMPGSKRIPDLDIGDNGETVLELWCKGGKGQFSVAGNTLIFVAGPMRERPCPADRAQADDELMAALSPPPGSARAIPCSSSARERCTSGSIRIEGATGRNDLDPLSRAPQDDRLA